MIRTGKRTELVQLAKDLLEPLLENVHQDIANLRAEIVHEGKQRVLQDRRIDATIANRDQEIEQLRKALAAFREKETEYSQVIDEIRQDRSAMKSSLDEVRKKQGGAVARMRRIEQQHKALLAKVAGNE